MSNESSAAQGVVDVLCGLASDTKMAPVVKDAIARINQAIKKDGSKRVGTQQAVNMATLARYVLYLALAQAEKTRKGTTKHLAPAWAGIVNDYNTKFLPRTRESLDIVEITDEDLTALCRFDTRRQGSSKKNLYAGLALFLVDQAEQKNLEHEFMKFALPASELSYIEQLSRLFKMTASGRAVIPEEPEESDGYPEVAVKFSYQRARLSELASFHTHFKVPEDACAHFICYRPRKTEPLELMKTFLALKPPNAREFPLGADSSSYNFVHLYKRSANLKKAWAK